uniref:Uncharacterized protein n=1 Tax=Rhizophora mucronata TaxID=61149 RepID=A0A2P2NIV0_RHIMU
MVGSLEEMVIWGFIECVNSERLESKDKNEDAFFRNL